MNLLHSILHEKCPKCSTGEVYQSTKTIFHLPEMHEKCSECGYRFDRESGYFIGAMYISYALGVFQGLLAFALYYFFLPPLPVGYVVLLISLVVLMCSRKNYTLSRIIYIHIFPW
ncbi:MAG: DUF983 domain-containing protein [Bacteroidota bacterium]